jgi:hypothetical protein
LKVNCKSQHGQSIEPDGRKEIIDLTSEKVCHNLRFWQVVSNMMHLSDPSGLTMPVSDIRKKGTYCGSEILQGCAYLVFLFEDAFF